MDFMGFNIIDIGIITLALFLAIKGLVNGFSKELLNFLTIIGGIAAASRFNTTVVEFINSQGEGVLPHISEAYTKLIGFVAILFAVWIVMGVVSSVIHKMTSGETGIISRLFGYILSFARYAFIFSLIVFGVNNSDFFKEKASKYYEKSKLFKPMAHYGALLLNVEEKVDQPTPLVETETKVKNNSSEIIKTIQESNNSSLMEKLTLPLVKEHNSSNK